MHYNKICKVNINYKILKSFKNSISAGVTLAFILLHWGVWLRDISIKWNCATIRMAIFFPRIAWCTSLMVVGLSFCDWIGDSLWFLVFFFRKGWAIVRKSVKYSVKGIFYVLFSLREFAIFLGKLSLSIFLSNFFAIYV